eukprot:TRINITY_DN12027_c0_g1_i3.p1 TRINITY_DN12027_c0_g1~~TRINITY_DN12027_c0_g1_i3.p1  ORF type:complete len:107 (+),score=5.93 TRINITY_DN12027_c0_g1_i3:22-342(+)
MRKWVKRDRNGAETLHSENADEMRKTLRHSLEAPLIAQAKAHCFYAMEERGDLKAFPWKASHGSSLPVGLLHAWETALRYPFSRSLLLHRMGAVSLSVFYTHGRLR